MTLTPEQEAMLATCRLRIPSLLQSSDVEGRPMPDPDGVRQAGRVLRPGGLYRLIERIP